MSSLASDAVPAPSRVLIVDDAPENLRILSESLRGDYTIMFAKNGRPAPGRRRTRAGHYSAGRDHARHERL